MINTIKTPEELTRIHQRRLQNFFREKFSYQRDSQDKKLEHLFNVVQKIKEEKIND